MMAALRMFMSGELINIGKRNEIVITKPHKKEKLWIFICTGHLIMFCMITNIYNKKTKGPTLMELFTATGKLKSFLTTRDVRCVRHG
jgi:hypothetical protein